MSYWEKNLEKIIQLSEESNESSKVFLEKIKGHITDEEYLFFENNHKESVELLIKLKKENGLQ